MYRSLCEFLGIDAEFSPPELGASANRFVSFRSARVRRLTKTLPASLGRVVGRLNSRAVDSYPPMRAETRRKMVEVFARDNAALGVWLGRDLEVWSR